MVSVKQLCLITIICSLGGIIFYGFYDEKIHIDYSIRQENAPSCSESNRSLTFFFAIHDSLTTITKTHCINTIDNEALKNIVNIWLTYLFEYDNKLQKIMCHSFIIKNSLYYCSFTATPFTVATSLYEKYAFFEGLLRTLYDLNPSFTGVVFLINHKIFEDEDCDFSLPWSYQLCK